MLRIADELFPVIIVLVKASVMISCGFAAASAQIVFAMYVREVVGGGLIFRHVRCYKRDG